MHQFRLMNSSHPSPKRLIWSQTRGVKDQYENRNPNKTKWSWSNSNPKYCRTNITIEDLYRCCSQHLVISLGVGKHKGHRASITLSSLYTCLSLSMGIACERRLAQAPLLLSWLVNYIEEHGRNLWMGVTHLFWKVSMFSLESENDRYIDWSAMKDDNHTICILP